MLVGICCLPQESVCAAAGRRRARVSLPACRAGGRVARRIDAVGFPPAGASRGRNSAQRHVSCSPTRTRTASALSAPAAWFLVSRRCRRGRGHATEVRPRGRRSPVARPGGSRTRRPRRRRWEARRWPSSRPGSPAFCFRRSQREPVGARSRTRTGTARRPTRFKLVVSAFHHPGTGSWNASCAAGRTWPSRGRGDEPIQGHPPNCGARDRCCLILLAADGPSATASRLRSPVKRGSARQPAKCGMTESRRSSGSWSAVRYWNRRARRRSGARTTGPGPSAAAARGRVSYRGSTPPCRRTSEGPPQNGSSDGLLGRRPARQWWGSRKHQTGAPP